MSGSRDKHLSGKKIKSMVILKEKSNKKKDVSKTSVKKRDIRHKNPENV